MCSEFDSYADCCYPWRYKKGLWVGENMSPSQGEKAAADNIIGKTIAHYKILEKIGEGGMGVVYKAEDTKLKRTVALKFLPPEMTRDAQAKARFVQEAQAAAGLDHPNICAVFEIGETEGSTYIAMPYVKGQSLKERIAAGPLSMDEALAIAGQVAEGLKEAHERGIIHRDIKPANIMLTEKGQAKIMDFGLAKLESGLELTRTMAVMGTAAYMSPEQARGEEVDQRADIWSFGATLCEMLTGQKPFGQRYDQAPIYSILNDTTESVSRIRPEIPKPLDRVIQKALEKDRFLRYQNIEQLLKDLKSIQPARPSVQKDEKSVVVLPFEDISPGKDNEYFADGLTEEIITDLSHVHKLLVISRSSAMTFKGTKKTIPEIARAVNVRYVLEGSVRKAGNSLRITAQLIDAANDAHIWAEKYTGTLDDVFNIQEKVSRAIVAGLKLKLAPNEERKIVEHPVANASAHDSYLRAKHEIARGTESALDRALKYLESALEMAGESAYLLAGLAQVYAAYVSGGFRLDEGTRRKAKQHACRALELDSNLAPAHSALGIIAYMGSDPRNAFSHLKHAVALEPNDANSVIWFATAAASVGRISSSRPYVECLLQADPLNPVAHQAAVAPEFYEGRFDTALLSARVALRLDPDAVLTRYWCVLLLAANRQSNEAHALLDQWKSQMPDHPYLLAITSWVHALEGRKNESSQLLAKTLMNEDIRAGMRADPAGVWVGAEIHAMNGDFSEALEWLEHGLDIGAINYPFLAKLDPWLANIRTDERFQKLMERVEYEWEHFEV